MLGVARALAFGSLFGLVGYGPGAHSQTATPDATAGLAEIVVTAERRTERITDVPASVITVSGQELQAAGVTRFQDLGLLTPSVQIANSGTYNQPAIRGVSTTFAAGGQEANVAVYVDGFYNADQLSINQDLVNIQDIQVLKGPQGTLYGRNATGGAILINTFTPGSNFEARANAGYSPEFNEEAVAAYVAGPIANGISLGTAINYRQNDGYIKDVNDFAPNAPIRFPEEAHRGSRYSAPYENYSIRPKLVVSTIDDVKIIVGYNHAYVSDARMLAFTAVGNLANAAPSYNGYPTTTEQDRTSLNFRPLTEITTDEANLTAEFGLGSFGTLTNRSAYRWQHNYQMYDLDGTALDPETDPYGTGYTGILHEKRGTYTQQLDLVAKPAPTVDLLAGLFYYRDEYDQTGIQDLGLAGNPTTDNLNFRTRSWAAYVDSTFQISDPLFLTVGGRYSDDKKSYQATRVDNTGAIDLANSVVGYYPGGEVSLNSNSFTPRANLRYALSPSSSVYFSWSKGFKSATINDYAPYNVLKPEKVTSYEVGYKLSTPKLRAEVAAFYYNFKDNQISDLESTTGGIQTIIANSGGAHIYGLDSLLAFPVDDHLTIQASAAYLHARYTDFPNAADTIIDPRYGFNTTIVGDWSGRQLARAPDWTASLGADYAFELARGKASLNFTGHYSSSYAPQDSSYACNAVVTSTGAVACPAGFDAKDAPGRFLQGSYFLANTQASWTDPSEHWTVTLYCDNCTDTRIKINSQALFYATLQVLNEPRTVGIRAALRY